VILFAGAVNRRRHSGRRPSAPSYAGILSLTVVAHFAAMAYVGESTENPSLYYRTNSMGALSVLDAVLAANVPSILFSSTCASYGVPNTRRSTKNIPQLSNQSLMVGQS